MPLGLWNLQWLNLNSQRRYPLTDDSTATDTSGAFQLPDDFLLELDLPIHSGLSVDAGRFFLRTLGVYSTGYALVVGYQPDVGDAINVASASIFAATHTPNTPYALGGIGDYADTVGKVTIGRLDNINRQPPGIWTFTLATARLDPDAIRPIIRGVSALICVNGDQVSVPLQGDIVLMAGTNMRLVPILRAGQNPIIRLDAIAGEGTIDPCACEGEATVTNPIMRINGVGPTVDGNWALVGSDCVTVEPIANGLKITDTCSQPCCGCAELERITTDLERLQGQAVIAQNFVNALGVQVETMNMTVLGSRLGDNSCVSCS